MAGIQLLSAGGAVIGGKEEARSPIQASLVPLGGTRIAVSGDNLQMETAINNSQVNDIGIATTGALTAGTKTIDANAIGLCIGGVGTAAITALGGNTTLISPQSLLDALAGGQPLILANQEGFVIRTTHAGPASLTYVAGFTVQWREVTAY